MITTIIAPLKTAISGMDLFTTGTDTRLAGVTIPVTKTDREGRIVTFPVSCDADGTACYEQGRYFELLPNDRYRAVIYFEQLTDVRFTGYKPEGGKDRVMIYVTDIRLIGWLNAKKLGSADCSITDRVALEIITTLTATAGETSREAGRFSVTDENFTNAIVEIVPIRQVRQDATIFSRYTLRETVLMYPWDYFAIDFTCYLYVGRNCFTPVAAGAEIEC